MPSAPGTPPESSNIGTSQDDQHMRLGIVNQETWGFFHEIFAAFERRYSVSVFTRRHWKLQVFQDRINKSLFLHDLRKFLAGNDVVFFEWASEVLVNATHLPKVCGIVARLHRYELYRWADHINWDSVDRIILVSHAKKKEFLDRFPSQAEKIIVSGPSTSLEKFTPRQKTFKGDIGILCRLTPRKRVYDLILAFYALLQQNSDLHLHVAGGIKPDFEDYYHALHSIVGDLGIREKVTFYGHVTDPWNWYHNIDIFISNSYSEGLQVAPMEAMASGCYCLSHRWRGAEELLPDEYLFYTDAELKEKVIGYCAMTELERDIHRKRMRLLAEEKFDINHTIRKILQAVDDVGKEPRFPS
jgi:glycosyltransferase involved in cell wall biosynthesis